jgi:hypothetical protein
MGIVREMMPETIPQMPSLGLKNSPQSGFARESGKFTEDQFLLGHHRSRSKQSAAAIDMILMRRYLRNEFW